MNAPSPSLKTLLAWADLARSGQAPAALDGWRRSTADAAARWKEVVDALDRHDSGQIPLDEPQSSVDQIAAYLEDRLSAAEAASFERLCRRSRADFHELISELRFGSMRLGDPANGPVETPVSPLVDRLLSLHPAAPTIVAPPVIVPPAAPLVAPPPAAIRVEPATLPPSLRPRPAQRSRSTPTVVWLAVGGAALVLLLLFAAIWNSGGFVTHDRSAPQLTRDSFSPRSDRSPNADPQRPPTAPRNSPPAPNLSPSPDESIVESPVPRGAAAPPREQVASPSVPSPAPRPAPPRPDATRPPSPSPSPARDPATTLVALRSELGAALVPGDSPGSWRVGQGARSLEQPLTIVSLADSWTTCDVAGLGTFIFAGDSRATLSQASDHSLHVSLEYGRVGVRDLAESAAVRFEAAGERWTARGQGDYATFGVVHDGDAAAVFVAAGIIAVDDATVRSGEATRIQAGAASVPASFPAQVAANLSPFQLHPYDDRWLKAPDDKRKRDWRAQYGTLADRLAAADDASAELRELRDQARDGRQHALLAAWNLSLADDRNAALWDMLGDRQKFVRAAAARELLSWPPRDGRLRAFLQTVRAQTDDRTAALLLDWIGRTHRPAPLARAPALEMVDNLSHSEVAVRQLAAFLLEFHAQDGLRAARLRAPSFDPRDSAAKREATQAQWRAIAMRLFAARAVSVGSPQPKVR